MDLTQKQQEVLESIEDTTVRAELAKNPLYPGILGQLTERLVNALNAAAQREDMAIVCAWVRSPRILDSLEIQAKAIERDAGRETATQTAVRISARVAAPSSGGGSGDLEQLLGTAAAAFGAVGIGVGVANRSAERFNAVDLYELLEALTKALVGEFRDDDEFQAWDGGDNKVLITKYDPGNRRPKTLFGVTLTVVASAVEVKVSPMKVEGLGGSAKKATQAALSILGSLSQQGGLLDKIVGVGSQAVDLVTNTATLFGLRSRIWEALDHAAVPFDEEWREQASDAAVKEDNARRRARQIQDHRVCANCGVTFGGEDSTCSQCGAPRPPYPSDDDDKEIRTILSKVFLKTRL